MKKSFFALAALTIVFASCVKNDPPPPAADNSALKGKLYINEVNGWPDQDPDKNFELYNATDQPVSLEGFYLVYTEDRKMWQGRADDVIPAKGYKLIQGARTTYPGFETGLSNRNPNVYLTFYDDEGKVIDHYEKLPDLRGTDIEFRCHMRIPDGGKWYYVPTTDATPGATNLTAPPSGAIEMPSMEKGLRIESLSVSSSNPAPNVDVTIKALVTDLNVITSVVLKWKKDNADQPDIPMTKEENEYVAKISGQPDGTVVNWTVLATNNKDKTVSQEGTITWATPAADYTKLKINEVNGCDGEKWFEIFNTGDIAINLEGVSAHYSNSEPASYNATPTWTGLESQTISAKGYFSTKGVTLGTGLSANNANVRLQLRAPDGTVLDTYQKLINVNTGQGYDHLTSKAHARIPDGTGPWYYTTNSTGTPGATNGISTEGYVKFGEEDGTGEPGEPDPLEGKLLILQAYGPNSSAAGASHPFVELYNTTNEPIDLSGITMYYADGTRGLGFTEDGAWKTIALTGTIPSEGSFLILGPYTSTGARLQIENNYGDINNANFELSNRAYKIAIIRSTATLDVQNPFDTDGRGAKTPGYIDMVGAANDYTNATNPDNIFGFETTPARCSASEAVRRKDLNDTDDNSVDFIAARYAAGGLTDEEVAARKPRNSKVGKWNPF